MIILILDDDEIRHNVYRRRYAGHDVWYTYSVKQFRSALHARRYDLISLDHDLGGGGTGFDAAMEIVHRLPAEMWPETVIVHSWSQSGGERMFDLLHRNGVNVVRQMFSVAT